MNARTPHARLAPGDYFDRFAIRTRLGQGHNAEVYRALHPQLKRDVALKIFHPEIARTESLTAMFISQANNIIALRHPNIMRVLASGITDNSYYLVMELLEGATLRDELAASPHGIERSTALRLFKQIASAVAYAHTQTIVHGNIKPDNIMLTNNKRPVLTDFTIPCFREHSSGRGGAVTPVYMAPEQLLQNHDSVRSDIFALGILLYEMLTGDVPFKGTTRDQLLHQHLQTIPTPPSKLCIGLDPRIEDAILTAIKHASAERFSSVSDMLSAIEGDTTSNPFETITLTREELARVQKRPTEIHQFERSRTASMTGPQENTSISKPARVLIGVIFAVVVVALIALALL